MPRSGVHPHDAAKVDDAGWRRIVAWAGDPRVVAIGETGLDYDRVFSPIPDQLTNLRRNLGARARDRQAGDPPLPLGGRRDAQDALVAALLEAGVGGAAWASTFPDRPPAVIHSFSGPLDYAKAVIDLGLAISFSGLVFRRGEEASADAVADRAGRSSALIETDSPFLSPPGAPRSRNEPEWVRVTGAWVAERRGTTPDAMGPALIAAYDRTFPSPRRTS